MTATLMILCLAVQVASLILLVQVSRERREPRGSNQTDFSAELRHESEAIRQQLSTAIRESGEGLTSLQSKRGQELDRRLSEHAAAAEQGFAALRAALEHGLRPLRDDETGPLARIRLEQADTVSALGKETASGLEELRDSVLQGIGVRAGDLLIRLEDVATRVARTGEADRLAHEGLRSWLDERLLQLQDSGNRQREHIRTEGDAVVRQVRDEVSTAFRILGESARKSIAREAVEQMETLAGNLGRLIEAQVMKIESHAGQIASSFDRPLPAPAAPEPSPAAVLPVAEIDLGPIRQAIDAIREPIEGLRGRIDATQTRVESLQDRISAEFGHMNDTRREILDALETLAKPRRDESHGDSKDGMARLHAELAAVRTSVKAVQEQLTALGESQKTQANSPMDQMKSYMSTLDRHFDELKRAYEERRKFEIEGSGHDLEL